MKRSFATKLLTGPLLVSGLLQGCVSTDCGQEPADSSWQVASYDPSQAAVDMGRKPEPDPSLTQVQYDYWTNIQSIVADALVYPPKAMAAYCGGDVRIRVVMQADGTVVRDELLQKSGAGYLDQEALDVMKRIGKLPPVPHSSPGVRYYVFELPLNFSIRR